MSLLGHVDLGYRTRNKTISSALKHGSTIDARNPRIFTQLRKGTALGKGYHWTLPILIRGHFCWPTIHRHGWISTRVREVLWRTNIHSGRDQIKACENMIHVCKVTPEWKPVSSLQVISRTVLWLWNSKNDLSGRVPLVTQWLQYLSCGHNA